jgi:hypothetical protein
MQEDKITQIGTNMSSATIGGHRFCDGMDGLGEGASA